MGALLALLWFLAMLILAPACASKLGQIREASSGWAAAAGIREAKEGRDAANRKDR